MWYELTELKRVSQEPRKIFSIIPNIFLVFPIRMQENASFLIISVITSLRNTFPLKDT